MRRRLRRVLLGLLLGALPVLFGAVTALLFTEPGRVLLARETASRLGQLLRGRFEVGGISGSFLSDLTLDRVVVRDTSGALLASLPRAELRFRLPSFFAGRIVFSSVRLRQPVIYITKHANGRMNYEEVLRLGEGSGTGPSPLVMFRNLQISGGLLRLSLPWSPPDTARTDAQVAAALAADRARPGRVVEETPEGLHRIITFSPLTVTFGMVRVSSPTHLPLTFDLDTLDTRVSDPAITVRDLAAHGWTKGDSLAISVAHGSLPGTQFSGGGVVTWPNGPIRFDLALEIPRVDLADLHWISPDFPEMTGSAVLAARAESDSRTAYLLQDLRLGQGAERVSGQLTALVDQRRGLGFRGLNLETVDLDLDVVRPYLDTLPFHGTLSGTTVGDGFNDGMDVDLHWKFRDAEVPGEPENRIAMRGHVVLSSPEGFVFDTVALDEADLDLRTIREVAPSVALNGRLSGSGRLEGPWKNVTFNGVLAHQDGDHPVSQIRGLVGLDTRGPTLGLTTDVQVEPLWFDGIRPSFPALTAQGSVSGHLRANGHFDHLAVEADLRGDMGALLANGHAVIDPPRWGGDNLTLAFAGLDLSQLRPDAPRTNLNGRAVLTGSADTLRGPEGRLLLNLSPSSVREFEFDSASAGLAVLDSLLQVDTVQVQWPYGRLDGGGTLGWSGPRSGHLHLEASTDSLAAFDSLITVLFGLERDTAAAARPLSGAVSAEAELRGGLDSLDVQLDATATNLAWQSLRTPTVAVHLGYRGGQRAALTGSLQVDSITSDTRLVEELRFEMAGWMDSLAWAGSAAFGDSSQIRAGGRWLRPGGASVLGFDSVVASLPERAWRLVQPGEVTIGDSALALTPFRIDAEDGSGSIRVAGRVPRAGRGGFNIGVQGLGLRDLYTILGRDTTDVSGVVALDLDVGGTGDAPTIQGTASLADGRFGEFSAPFMQSVVNYSDRQLETNLLVWKTGTPVLRVEAHLPLDLALHRVSKRQVAGPLQVAARADSTDLGILEAFTTSVRRVRGVLTANALINGTWDDPRLSGFIGISDGSVAFPGLGVQFIRLNGRARLAGDSISLDTVTMSSGRGTLAVTGGLRLERMTRPVLNLRMDANDFRAIDERNLLTLDAAGYVILTGPVFGARLTGRVTANSGVLHFADLITKRIVDLENPADSGLIDLTLIRRQKLGTAVQNRFLDSLRIEDLTVTMGESSWLRSSEANIQLEGSVTVNKTRQDYRLDGTLTALRGTYALKIGFVTRNFVVERGTVRYFGTPDLNAELDIQATHTVHTVPEGEEIPVIAKITGTLLAPKLSLESTQRPPLSETELVSYLMFGKPSFSLSGGNSAQGTEQLAKLQTAVSYLSSALSSELQRTLISDLGVPIDYIEIRPGEVSSGGPAGTSGVAQVAQLAAGWQIGRKWFVTVNADVCTNQTRFYPNVEFRISREFRFKTSVEPTQPCAAFRQGGEAITNYNKYQVGFDLLWEREQ